MTISRKIPSVMFSQHPDHAGRPYWHTEPYIQAHDELKECLLMFTELGAQEMMWDWEGKFVDEAVIERFLGQQHPLFKIKPLGRDLFLTFRVPNPRVESGYRLGRAFMVILSSEDLAHAAGLPTAPLFEVILPMTERASEILKIQKSYKRLAKAAMHSFGSNKFTLKPIEVIPLFERVPTIINAGHILDQYVRAYRRSFSVSPSYLRPFVARSDPALNSGIVPTTLALKCALFGFQQFSRRTGIPTYPIIAPGSLPFRGGLTPDTVKEFIHEFAGVRTVVIQSAFRYDYPKSAVKKAIQTLIRRVPQSQVHMLSDGTVKDVQNIIPWFERPYKRDVEHLAPMIQRVAAFIPKRRERVQHIGLFGYSRSVGSVTLPRAIGFTASCYSLGIPPELLGTGAGLRRALKEKKMTTIESLYTQLRPALVNAGRFLSKESVEAFGSVELKKGIQTIESYLGASLGPQSKQEHEHADLVSRILFLLSKRKNPTREIEEAAMLRHALG